MALYNKGEEPEKIKTRLDYHLKKLEEFYPEHKIFSFDSVLGGSREVLVKISKELEYQSIDEMLSLYGFEIISVDEAKKIINKVIYAVGNEPSFIKPKITSILNRLEKAYPDRHIHGSLQKNHKNLSQDITGIYLWLGYPSIKDFLKAYGFEYELENLNGGRRKTVNEKEIIEHLQKKYPKGSTFHSVKELMEDNPELSGNLKTLQNNAKQIFGLPLGEYLLSIGLIQPKMKKEIIKKPKKKKNYTLCQVRIAGTTLLDYYILKIKSKTKTNYVEIPFGIDENIVLGIIEKEIICNEDSAPCDISKTKEIIRKLSLNKFKKGLIKSCIQVHAILDKKQLLSQYLVHDFQKINYPTVEFNGEASWACIRGLTTEILDVIEYLKNKDNQTYDYTDIILLDNGIAELYIFKDDIFDILNNFSNVKIVMFVENLSTGLVSLYYSKSGYSVITDHYEIGNCDFEDKTKWTLKYSPEEDFTVRNINHVFKYKDDWNSLNYVFNNSDGILVQFGK